MNSGGVCVRAHVCVLHVCACMCVCVHTCVHVPVCTCACVGVCACACVCVRTRMRVCVCVFKKTCGYKNIILLHKVENLSYLENGPYV